MSKPALNLVPSDLEGQFISVHDYMAQGNEKYYASRDPFGENGDFITAPEVSQMFGEVLGAWCIMRWDQLGRPSPVHLIELGPGRGTMMSDILRVAKKYPNFYSALHVHMVETSPILIDAQRTSLIEFAVPKTWHQNLDKIPHGPTLLLANEFFDALPVEHYIMTALGWQQRGITFVKEQAHFTAREITQSPLLPENLPTAVPGQIYEYNPQLRPIVEKINARLKTAPGSAIIIDYGYTRDTYGETLQAVSAHHKINALQAWGNVDLTAHVNFAAIAQIARAAGITVYGPTTQGKFLRAIGIEERGRHLFESANADDKVDILDAMMRLAADEEMGVLFKVICLSSPDAPVPEGF